jgi:hypothetical protein
LGFNTTKYKIGPIKIIEIKLEKLAKIDVIKYFRLSLFHVSISFKLSYFLLPILYLKYFELLRSVKLVKTANKAKIGIKIVKKILAIRVKIGILQITIKKTTDIEIKTIINHFQFLLFFIFYHFYPLY